VSFETLTLSAALHIVKNMRASDRECLTQMMADFTDESFAVNRWQTDGAAWQFLQDGVPVIMGGIQQPMPWVGVAWMVSTEGVRPESWKKLLRFSRTVFGNASKTIPRLEANVLQGWNQAAKYAEKVGFAFEGTRYRSARDGRNVLVYAITGEQ
jgi:hypothetical protein